MEISKTLQLSSDFLVHFVVVDASLGWILVWDLGGNVNLEGTGLNGILGLGEILGLSGILGLEGNTKFFRSKPAAQQGGPDPEEGG